MKVVMEYVFDIVGIMSLVALGAAFLFLTPNQMSAEYDVAAQELGTSCGNGCCPSAAR